LTTPNPATTVAPAVTTRRAPKPRAAKRSLTKWMLLTHLWVGILLAFLVVVLSVTGVLLNHKRALGLMPESGLERPGAFASALPLTALAERATAQAPAAAASAGIDRMDVRPADGLVKVRFNDVRVTELTLALDDGSVLGIGSRKDNFLENLHSGDIFGEWGVLLSDFAAVALLVLFGSGVWLWLYPKAKAR
jgi:uncharacterized iron-regulated membrane protein